MFKILLTNVLNVRSKYSVEELDKIRKRPIRTELTEEPSMGEVIRAVQKLKERKAGGSSEILPEGWIWLRRIPSPINRSGNHCMERPKSSHRLA